jgi:hypothetical protein
MSDDERQAGVPENLVRIRSTEEDVVVGLYRLFGIEDNADKTALKKAYGRLRERYRPESNSDDPLAPAIVQYLDTAYARLMDRRASTASGNHKLTDGSKSFRPNAAFAGIALASAALLVFFSFGRHCRQLVRPGVTPRLERPFGQRLGAALTAAVATGPIGRVALGQAEADVRTVPPAASSTLRHYAGLYRTASQRPAGR